MQKLDFTYNHHKLYILTLGCTGALLSYRLTHLFSAVEIEEGKLQEKQTQH